MRILLIEDEKKTAAFIRKGLEEEGYAVEVARDGEAACNSRSPPSSISS
jgi:DNA-binding response OmpR family regulator